MSDRLEAIKMKLAIANFKKENPHLSSDQYFHDAEKSMTVRSFLAGTEALAEVYRLEGEMSAHKEIAEFNDASKETILRHLFLMHEANRVKLESLLARLEGEPTKEKAPCYSCGAEAHEQCKDICHPKKSSGEEAEG